MPSPIDPELNYCPRCQDEYRTEIRTCAACAVALVSGVEMLDRQQRRPASRPEEIGPQEAVVSVHKGSMLQVKALQTHLLDRGLASRVTKEDGGACGCKGVEVLLQVRESDLPEVAAALAEEYRQSTGLSDHDTRFAGAVYNPEANEALCPACGCRFAPRLTECPDCGLCFA
jgi:hypothetical protein